MPSPAEKLAAEVRAALELLQDASSASLTNLRQRQARAYTTLWDALQRYERTAPGRRED